MFDKGPSVLMLDLDVGRYLNSDRTSQLHYSEYYLKHFRMIDSDSNLEKIADDLSNQIEASD